MNIEKLTRIKAALSHVIELAEKATPTPYGIEQTNNRNWVGPMRSDGSVKIREVIVSLDREGLKPESLVKNDNNASYIAHACNLGAPMAKSLLLAIEILFKMCFFNGIEYYHWCDNDGEGCSACCAAFDSLNTIITSFADEL